jgi:hypothetical protein
MWHDAKRAISRISSAKIQRLGYIPRTGCNISSFIYTLCAARWAPPKQRDAVSLWLRTWPSNFTHTRCTAILNRGKNVVCASQGSMASAWKQSEMYGIGRFGFSRHRVYGCRGLLTKNFRYFPQFKSAIEPISSCRWGFKYLYAYAFSKKCSLRWQWINFASKTDKYYRRDWIF